MAYNVEEILELLELSDYYSSKLSYGEATTLRGDGSSGKISKYGLTLVNQLLKCDYKQLERTVMQINEDIKSRNVTSDANQDSAQEGFSCFKKNKHRTQKLLHPMDTMTVLLSCCDDILRQILIEKLVSTRVSIPLVFYQVINNGTEPIILDWCVKNLFLESPSIEIQQKFLFEIDNPIISFFRLGNLGRSKSKLLSDILSNSIFEAFYHRECQSASAKRGPSNGSIEVAWFQSTDNSDACLKFNSKLFTILNLRGNASECPKQTKLLCESSSLVVIMADSFDSLTSWYGNVQNTICWKGKTIAILIVSGNEICLEADQFLQECPLSSHVFDIGVDCEGDNPMTFIEWQTSVQDIIAKFMKNIQKERCFTLENFIENAKSAGFQLEEVHRKVENYRVAVNSFVNCVQEKYPSPELMLQLQGDPLRALSTLIRKKERDSAEEGQSAEDFVNCLKKEMEAQRTKQIKMIQEFTTAEQKFYELLLESKYNEFMIIVTVAKQRLAAKSGTICKLFRAENIVRELGQMYEAVQSPHCLDPNLPETFIKPSQIQKCAMIAADMLLLGHPLELLNGDAFCIPTIWLEAVFKNVSEKTNCGKVFVLSVMGVQSSGKSTLLNALFGLNFPTSAGKCTSGLYCHLLPIAKTTIRCECDYVMILDAEGFRAPEYMGRYTERDNEMATFIVGLSDLTIVNIEGENWSDMEDILQIVVYALLRIKQTTQVEFMPSCVFVHQKVSALDFREKIKTGKATQLKYLDEMVEASAKREVYMNITAFGDVVDYNSATDLYHLPNKWLGNPPFATVSSDYSNAVANLKNIIIRKIISKDTCMRFTDMCTRMKDLWDAVLSENFIFRFRDTKQALAYQSLSSAFYEIEWNFRISNNQMMTTIANKVLSLGNSDEFDRKKENLMQELRDNIKQNCKKAGEALEKALSSDGHNARLIRESFEKMLKSLSGDEDSKAEIAFNTIIAIHSKKLENSKQIEVMKKEIVAELLRDREIDALNGEDYFDRKWEEKFSSEKERHENALRDSNENIRKAIKNMLPADSLPMFDSQCDSRSGFEMPKVSENDLVKKAFRPTAKAIKTDKKVHKMDRTAFANEICKKLFDTFTKHLETLNSHEFDESQIKTAFDNVWDFFGRESPQNEGSGSHGTGYSKLWSGHRDISYPGSNLKKDFILKYFAAVGYYAYVKLNALAEDFLLKTDAYFDIKNQQQRVKKVFLRRKEPTFILASHIMDEIETATFENVNLTVTKALEEHDMFYKNKQTFIARLLKDLAENKTMTEEEIFSAYLEFFTNFEQFCEDKLRYQIQKFLNIDSNCSKIASRLTTDIKILVKKVQDSMTSSGNECSSNNFLEFLKIFREKLEGKIAFCPEKVLGGFSQMIIFDSKTKNIGLLEMVDQLKRDLELLSDSDISKKVRSHFEKKSIKDIYQRILSGCSEKCPFCSAPCLELAADHTPHVKHHSLHYPVGVRGIVHRGRKWHTATSHGKKYRLVTDYCPSLIQSAKSFQPAGKTWRGKLQRIFGRLFQVGLIKYKDYQKEYPDWQIPRLSEMKENDNDYWKWLMNKFGQEFASHYNVKHPKNSNPKEVELCPSDCGVSSICALLLDGGK